MRAGLCGAGLAALALAGCAVPPILQPAQAPVAEAVAATPAPAWVAPVPHGGQASDLRRWWAQFDDAVLVDLIDAAQAASPDLALATARVERARAAQTVAAAPLLPQAQGGLGASRGRADLSLPVVTTLSQGLQASWEIDVFGAVRAGRDASVARWQGSQAAWHAARVSVAAETASAYLSLRACEAQWAQTAADADSRNETARVTGQLAQAGFSSPATAALARGSAAQARAQARAAQAQCELQTKGLVALTAWDEPLLRQRLAAGMAKLPQPAPLDVAALPASVLAQRPDLAEAAAAVAAAAADHRVADARQWPQLSLSGNFTRLRVDTGAGNVQGNVWSFGPLQVSFPVFDGGSNRAQADAARASHAEAVALYQAKARTAVREVEQALVTLDSTAARAADAQSAADGYDAALKATQALFKNGLASVFELEDARRGALSARSALIELQRERTAAWIGLYRALGGGWQSGEQAVAATSPTP